MTSVSRRRLPWDVRGGGGEGDGGLFSFKIGEITVCLHANEFWSGEEKNDNLLRKREGREEGRRRLCWAEDGAGLVSALTALKWKPGVKSLPGAGAGAAWERGAAQPLRSYQLPHRREGDRSDEPQAGVRWHSEGSGSAAPSGAGA